jgi:hypothetical protein
MTPSAKPYGTGRDAKICGRTPLTRNHPRIVEPIRRKLLLYQKEGWKITSCPRLPTHQQMDEEK